MKYLSLLVVAVSFLLGACERHSWDDDDANGDGIIQESEKGTSRLYEGHGGHDDHAKEGDKHGHEAHSTEESHEKGH